jgi:hypothetical protein
MDLRFFANGTQVDVNGEAEGNTFTYGSNPVINHVFLAGADGVTYRADNLTLTAVPEPGTAFAVLLGGADYSRRGGAVLWLRDRGRALCPVTSIAGGGKRRSNRPALSFWSGKHGAPTESRAGA